MTTTEIEVEGDGAVKTPQREFAEVTPDGHILCPHCETIHITPIFFDKIKNHYKKLMVNSLVPIKCVCCHNYYVLDQEATKKHNHFWFPEKF